MGLFGSRRKTRVATSIQRVIKDDLMPDSVKSSLVKSLFQNGNIAENLIDEFLQSLGVRVERMYEFGKRNYVHGLPSGSFENASEGRKELQVVLEAIEGQPVVIQYSRYGAHNLLHLGWMHLQVHFQYDPETNTFPTSEPVLGAPLYLVDMQPVVSKITDYDPESLELWGTAASAGYTPLQTIITDPRFMGLFVKHSPVLEDPTKSEGVLVKTVWQEKKTRQTPDGTENYIETHRDELFVPVGVPDPEAEYFHAKYTVNGKVKYWTYQIGSGVYPTLDKIHDAKPTLAGQYFPFLYYRYNKTSEITNTSTIEYKHGRKMAKYLNMDYKKVGKAIDENPDIKDVEQAMVMLAVPAMSKDQEELKYLWEYFDRWFYNSDEQFQTSDLFNLDQLLKPGKEGLDIVKSAVIIQDKRFKMALSHGGIFKTTKAMVIGKKGTIKVETGKEVIEVPYRYMSDGNWETKTATFHIDTHIYTKQISDGVCEQIEILNLKMKYYVWGEYTVTADDEDDTLLIPLDRSLIEHMSIPKKELIYARALHYVFNSRTTIKLRWYQTGIFRVIMFIVAVVISYFFPPAGAAMLTAATGSALVTAIIISVIINVIVTFAMKLIVKYLGVDVAAIIAVIALIVGAYSAMTGSNIFANLPWGEQLLTASNNLVSATSSAIGDAIGDIYNQMGEFSLFADRELEELNRLSNEALSETQLWNPMVLFGESPEQYYNRTVHAGNVGVVGIEAVSSFVERSLTLPKIEETITFGEEGYE